ncbi:AEC family transporter [Serpentinicella sp. ANB-PHB4]|uniref:AEC family transporter n=1 Tax=Serpentinicella sp. ANB-PHB4 TaxID=3074076 RepID=UPI00285B8EEC|nr:AEC family transporter [Serpentinicella sp. ANB-PHB4]MDR5659079.1 AEC family transporter [Serpentinicella sp. ANB-PHB4]
MNDVNNQFILSMLIIMLGYILKRCSILTEKDGNSIAKIIFNITLPSVVISTFSQITVQWSLITLSISQFAFGLFLTVIAIFTFRKEKRHVKGMLTMTLPGYNIGLFSFPFVEAIWGQSGLTYMAMFAIGNSFITFGMCYILASVYSSSVDSVDYKSISKRLIGSTPLMTYIITLSINLLGLQFPSTIIDMADIFARANMPLSLLLLGIYLSFSFDTTYYKNIIKLLSMRYILGLFFGILLFYIVPFDPILSYTFLIAFILPIGLVCLPYSVQFNYNQKFISTLINLSMIISFFLMWIIFTIAQVL